MRAFNFEHEGKIYKRISKNLAQKAFCEGKTVILSACNIRPFNPMGIGYSNISRMRSDFASSEVGTKNIFCDMVNSFEYYNCNNETGKYAAFYISE